MTTPELLDMSSQNFQGIILWSKWQTFQGYETVSHQISRKRCVIRQTLLQST